MKGINGLLASKKAWAWFLSSIAELSLGFTGSATWETVCLSIAGTTITYITGQSIVDHATASNPPQITTPTQAS